MIHFNGFLEICLRGPRSVSRTQPQTGTKMMLRTFSVGINHMKMLRNRVISAEFDHSVLLTELTMALLYGSMIVFFCDSKTHTKYNSLENSCPWDNFVSISTLSEDTLYGRIQILTLFLQVLKNIETLGSSIWTSLEGFPLVQTLAVLKLWDLERIVFDVILKDDS